MSLVGRLLQRLAAHLHSVCGWSAFRLGWSAHARRHFERVLVLRGSDFSAYVHLGRLSFAEGDYAGWRREFEHARRTDPERFAKLRHPFELFEPRLAGTDFDDTGERATWRTMRPFGAGAVRRSAGQRPDLAEAGPESLLPGWEAQADATADSPTPRAVDRSVSGEPVDDADLRDDCGSVAERRRLRELGPIRATEVERCDLDELLRRLSG